MMSSAQAPSAGCAGTSPMNGGGRNDDFDFVFPRLRGKWLSVSETEGGALRPGTERSRKLAKRLRREMTNAEVKLWVHLRKRDLCGHRFRRQHPIGPYVADFACVALKLIVEVDGGTHGTPEEIAHDRRRTRFLEAQGWTVIRCFNVDVYSNLDGVLTQIAEALINLDREAAVSRTNLSPQPAAAAPSARTSSAPFPRRGGDESDFQKPRNPVDRAFNPNTGKDVT
ncbi:Very-short-patch-repair endonuclease [Maricaulis salignorans]|uniref:Very-short-patch-repair endonuclease n=2 Tax=Maricaulis salignorans TaxID=144026 RepID=A0A1G9RXD7_9PROT|nr:Very-short-patch-repair endonuclease [Maricaulis salignorans]